MLCKKPYTAAIEPEPDLVNLTILGPSTCHGSEGTHIKAQLSPEASPSVQAHSHQPSIASAKAPCVLNNVNTYKSFPGLGEDGNLCIFYTVLTLQTLESHEMASQYIAQGSLHTCT